MDPYQHLTMLLLLYLLYSTSFHQQVHPSKGLHHYSTTWISYVFSCSRSCHRFSGAERVTIMMVTSITLLKALVPAVGLVVHHLDTERKT
jgi:hypothetical protein